MRVVTGAKKRLAAWLHMANMLSAKSKQPPFHMMLAEDNQVPGNTRYDISGARSDRRNMVNRPKWSRVRPIISFHYA